MTWSYLSPGQNRWTGRRWSEDLPDDTSHGGLVPRKDPPPLKSEKVGVDAGTPPKRLLPWRWVALTGPPRLNLDSSGGINSPCSLGKWSREGPKGHKPSSALTPPPRYFQNTLQGQTCQGQAQQGVYNDFIHYSFYNQTKWQSLINPTVH